MPGTLVSFEEARRIIEQHAATVRSPGTETVALLDAAGRVLSQDIRADRHFPPFRRAARDGYAVRSSDLVSVPCELRIVAEIRAGAKPQELPASVRAGEAAAIMTGAPTPDGADAIVMVEYTTRNGDRVEITRGVHAGENVVPTGSEAKEGEVLLRSGTRIGSAPMAVLASVGQTTVSVYRKPRVAILATGDEIVGIEQTPGPHQIRNSNTYSLAVQVKAAGAEAVILPVAPDEPKRLRDLIEEGLQSDLLLLSGGVSAGKYDLVEQILADLGAEFFFTGARIQPGKPIVFGRVHRDPGGPRTHPRHDVPLIPEQKYFFGLPGNPVSTMVTFDLFARPMIKALAGAEPCPLRFVQVRLKSDIRVKTGLKRFLPAVLSGEFEQAEVELVRWGGSGDVAATAKANCYVVIPPERDHIPAGEFVAVMIP